MRKETIHSILVLIVEKSVSFVSVLASFELWDVWRVLSGVEQESDLAHMAGAFDLRAAHARIVGPPNRFPCGL